LFVNISPKYPIDKFNYLQKNPFLVPSPACRGRIPVNEVQQVGRGLFVVNLVKNGIFIRSFSQ
jgi:hypothetical protein